MAKVIFFLLLAFSFTLTLTARILDQLPLPDDPLPPPTTPQEPPIIAPIPTTTTPPVAPTEPAAPVSDAPVSDNPPPVTTPPVGAHPTLSFFMHDILGGTQPSGRVVTGIVASSDASTLPFSKPNNQIFPVNGGVPLNTIDGVVNNHNYPFLVGLDGTSGGVGSSAIIQSNGNNVVTDGNSQAFVSAGQLPQGVTLQQLMFGSVTVVDNEITEGHELGTAVLGRAQGFYIASSSDGSTHTLVLSALFHGEHHEHEVIDTLSFFGIHRTATPVSHIAIIGGTGKYENAKGYATIETLPHVDQHTTDGVETITHFALYLTP